jgi:hypothetical protein
MFCSAREGGRKRPFDSTSLKCKMENVEKGIQESIEMRRPSFSSPFIRGTARTRTAGKQWDNREA